MLPGSIVNAERSLFFTEISISTATLHSCTKVNSPILLLRHSPNPPPSHKVANLSSSLMGNGLAKLTHCFSGGGGHGRGRHVTAAVTSEPFDEGLGHSFCYVRPDPLLCSAAPPATSKVYHHASDETTTFRTISGASVSANAATTPLSTSLLLSELTWPAAASFESSTSFTAVPLQPVPRFPSGPLSGPLDRGFLSGPIERGLFSGPLDGPPLPAPGPLRRSLSHALRPRSRRAASSLLRGLTKAIARTIKTSKEPDSAVAGGSSGRASVEKGESFSGPFDAQNANVQWAQGKAGEDRVHVVISEEQGWVFVGIYDGFNGPDATDYLLSNLYSAVQRELKGLLWEDEDQYDNHDPCDDSAATQDSEPTVKTTAWDAGRQRSNKRRKFRGSKCEWESERLELERRLKEQLSRSSSGGAVNHAEVLKALSQALRKTEVAYLDITDKMVSENPELALIGSCVLVMLMKGEDVYLMNVGDSRAVVAQKAEIGEARQDLEQIKEDVLNDFDAYDGGDHWDGLSSLAALQLTVDHSTSVEEEVRRIRNEHPDDASAIVNDRVKGSLAVTRAFGAGFLKQPKWNDALLEMFRIDYVGNSPYISSNPSLYHHKLGPKDRFLILSSDGLYQYFTNEEAVAQVELFIATTPEGDPAQHLVEEVLFRAANKAGIDFHELLEIPQGDRRWYHDDVSIIVISLEGRIWRSCV